VRRTSKYGEGADRAHKHTRIASAVRFDDKPRDKQGRPRGSATVTVGYMNRLRRHLYAVNRPEMANGSVKTLADMTPEERAAIEARYGAKIK
jgi:hypothetical protein